MGICYVKIVDNEFKGLKKVFLDQKKMVNNDFEKSLHIDGGGANLEKVFEISLLRQQSYISNLKINKVFHTLRKCMFCGNLFKSTNLQNHKESHMIKLIPRVERALVLTLNNEFEEQTRISKIPEFFFEFTQFFCLWGTVCL